jgi:hypothetical protein
LDIREKFFRQALNKMIVLQVDKEGDVTSRTLMPEDIYNQPLFMQPGNNMKGDGKKHIQAALAASKKPCYILTSVPAVVVIEACRVLTVQGQLHPLAGATILCDPERLLGVLMPNNMCAANDYLYGLVVFSSKAEIAKVALYQHDPESATKSIGEIARDTLASFLTIQQKESQQSQAEKLDKQRNNLMRSMQPS